MRGGIHPAPAGSPLDVISSHRDPDGEQLDSTIAAVELLNAEAPPREVHVDGAKVAMTVTPDPARRRVMLTSEFITEFEKHDWFLRASSNE